MTRIKHKLTVCLGAAALCFVCSPFAAAHIMDIIELPNEGGTQAIFDGNILNTFLGSETISAGANFNDGDYVPQVINVNLYEDAAHTIVSDRFTITVPVQNPPQITLGLTSDTDGGVPLQPLTPETIGLTETGLLQTIVTLTNSRGVQTTIRLQSDAPEAVTPAPVPEPSTIFLALWGLSAMVRLKPRRKT